MSLKGDRNIVLDDISYFTSATLTRGGILSVSTGGSGIALDSSVNVAVYNADPSGKSPIGVALEDVVDYDLTKQHINFCKDEVQVGSKICAGQIGWVVTDFIIGTPAAGDPAYFGASGYFQTTTGGTTVNPRVGVFSSSKDEDGFAKVSFRFPLS